MISTATAAVNASPADDAREEPAAERQGREDDHGGHEDGRDPIREALHGSLAGLCLLDEAGDLGERGVGPDARRLDDEAAVRVDGGAGDFRAHGDLSGRRLAGQERPVDRRLALDDDAVGGDLLTRADDEAIAHLERPDRDERLLAVPEHPRFLRAELQELLDRLRGAALRARLEVAPEQDQRRHDRAHLEVGLAFEAGDKDDSRPEPGGERAEGDQRVHRGHSVAGAPHCRAVEAEARVEHDRRRERKRDPLPAVELRRRHHREHRDRQRQRDREHEPAAERPAGVALTSLGRPGRRRPRLVTGRRDGRNEPFGRDRGVAAHRRPLGREVDGGRDAVEPVQGLLDPRGARGTGHAVELEATDRPYTP